MMPRSHERPRPTAACHRRLQLPAHVARPARARAGQLRLGPGHAGGPGRAALPSLRPDRLAAAERHARGRRALPAHCPGASRLAAELYPLIALALLVGPLAGRFDRRRLLLPDQIALVAVSGALCAAALAGD